MKWAQNKAINERWINATATNLQGYPNLCRINIQFKRPQLNICWMSWCNLIQLHPDSIVNTIRFDMKRNFNKE